MKRQRRKPARASGRAAVGVLPAPLAEALRAEYLARFGPLYDVRDFGVESEDKKSRAARMAQGKVEPPPFWVLCFWDPAKEGAQAVYASFGAPAGEVFLVSAIPIDELVEPVGEAALASPSDRAPPLLLGVRVPWTPFACMATLPDEDGSFTVRAEGGAARPVRRLAALLSQERGRASATTLAEVLDAVRAAGALVTDPLRAPVFDREPEETTWSRLRWATGYVRGLRDGIAVVSPETAGPGSARDPGRVAQRARAFVRRSAALAYFEARLPHVPTEAEERERITGGSDEERLEAALRCVIDRGLDRIQEIVWDSWTMERFAEFLQLFVLSHPDARPLLDAAIAGRDELPPPPPEGRSEQVRTLVDALHTAMAVIDIHYPGHEPLAMMESWREALARREPGDDDWKESTPLRIGWESAIRAMYKAVLPLRTPDERGIDGAYKMAATSSTWGHVPDGETPLERLVDLCGFTAFQLMLGYVMVRGRDTTVKSSDTIH